MNIDDYKPVGSCQISGLENIYFQHFGLCDNGLFVEIGAYDGKTYSNTYQLAKLGWSGIYVEPVSHLFEACKENHKNHHVQVVQAFVSSKSGEMVDLYQWGDNTFTGDADFIQNVVNGETKLVMQVPTCTLDTILEYLEVPSGFKLLVIDVEGHELEVLRGFALEYYRPQMIIIETHAMSGHPGLSMHASAIDAIMLANNYVCIYEDHINSIYIAR